ncbi:LytR/AlgR family response regulator transcription factor [Enterococcus faecalis]
MLRIYICEDNQLEKEKIGIYVKNYLLIMNYDAQLVLSDENPNVILENIKESQEESMFFLDIELNDKMNGIELAAKIKEILSNARIVFITSHAELTYLTFVYKVEAMDYIIKSNGLQQRITECIDVAMQRYHNGKTNEEYFSIHSNDVRIKILANSVLFFETTSVPHKIKINCENRNLEFYGNIKCCEDFSDSFFRCHKSFVINLNNVEMISESQRKVIFKNKQECPISTRYVKAIVEEFKKRF